MMRDHPALGQRPDPQKRLPSTDEVAPAGCRHAVLRVEAHQCFHITPHVSRRERARLVEDGCDGGRIAHVERLGLGDALGGREEE